MKKLLSFLLLLPLFSMAQVYQRDPSYGKIFNRIQIATSTGTPGSFIPPIGDTIRDTNVADPQGSIVYRNSGGDSTLYIDVIDPAAVGGHRFKPVIQAPINAILNGTSIQSGANFNIDGIAKVSHAGSNSYSPALWASNVTQSRGAGFQLADESARPSTLAFWTTGTGGPGGATPVERMSISPSTVAIGGTAPIMTGPPKLYVTSGSASLNTIFASNDGATVSLQRNAITAIDQLWGNYAWGAAGFNYASVSCYSTDAANGTRVSIFTTPVGSSTAQETMRLTPDGITGYGSIALNIRTVTATETVLPSDYTLVFDISADAAANLPAANTCTGKIYNFKLLSSGFTLTVTCDGSDLIDGAANTFGFSAQGQVLTLQSTGSGWVALHF